MAALKLPEDRRARAAVVTGGTIVLLLIFTQFVLPGSGEGGRGTPFAILFQGLITGLAFAVFTTGVILIYRTIRVINFAQGPLGIVGGVLVILLLLYTPVPFPFAVIASLLMCAGVGLVIGLFMLRFFNSARLFLVVVTIVGGGAIFRLIPFVTRLPFFPPINERTSGEAVAASDFHNLLPFKGFTFQVGDFPLPFGFGEVFAIELAVVALAAVGLFLRYTRAGVAVRALAENPERASLLGIGVGGLSVIVWIIAGALDGVAILVVLSGRADIGAGGLDSNFAILLPFLAAAVIARFQSLPVGIGAAIVIGIVGAAWDFSIRSDRQLFEVFLFLLIAGGLLLQRRRRERSESSEVSWAATTEPRPVPKEMAGITSLRIARWAIIAVGVIAVIVFPFVATTDRIFLGGQVFVNAIAVLSLVVLTGWAGQVSLGQFAFVAIGAVVGGALTERAGIPFWFAVPIATAITAGIAVVVGLPALRIKGLFLMVTTFAFAVAVSQVLFDERYFDWLLPRQVERPTLFFLNFSDERSMYFLCAIALVIAIVVVRNLRRSRVGRVLIAVRENEANLQAFGITAVRAKLLAFSIAGALAGFSGAVFAHQQRGVSIESFGADASVFVFVEAVVGGVSSAGGALLGSAYFRLAQEFGADNIVLASFLQGFGPLLIIFAAPGGFISLINQARDSVLRIVAQRRRLVVPSLFADYDPEALERQLIPLAEPDISSGLAAMPIDQRYALASGLYAGTGERVIDKLGPGRPDHDMAAIGAAARSAEESEFEREPVGAIPEGDS